MHREFRTGRHPTWCPPDPDGFREWVFRHKSTVPRDKRTTLKEAVAALVNDGDYVKLGGFGQVRTSMAAIHEVIRQEKRDLAVAGHTTSHDLDTLMSGGCVSRVEVGYSFGHELRPARSGTGPRLLKHGKLKVSEWTNASFAWRLKAAALGLSFIPCRSMLGTDTFEYSGAVEVDCPFTGKPYAALPALYPDVALIHVHRADRFGNARIDGMVVSDDDAARAARKVVVTAEELVDDDVFRRQPEDVTIPHYCVDAVVEVPYGSYPCEMPGRYWFDEPFMASYIKATHDEGDLHRWLEAYVFSAESWASFLVKAAGEGLGELEAISRGDRKPPRMAEVWGGGRG